MSRKPTVYIANRSGHNYSGAERFGQLVAVTQHRVNVFATDRLRTDITHALRDAKPEDLLLLGGSPLVNVLCAFILLQRHGLLNIIYWDGLKQDYIRRKLSFTEVDDGQRGEAHDQNSE